MKPLVSCIFLPLLIALTQPSCEQGQDKNLEATRDNTEVPNTKEVEVEEAIEDPVAKEDTPATPKARLKPEAKPESRKGKFIDYSAKFSEDEVFDALGYLVLPEGASAENPVPGIVVVHEWWGQTEYIRKRTEMLAGLGYAALAIDMYGNGQTADTINEAGQLMFQVSQEPSFIRERFQIGMQVLQGQPQVDPKKIASIGYSVGGKMAMQAAAYNPPNLLGVVVFHGAPDIDILKNTTEIKPRILICNGADDTLIIQESVDEFREDIANVKTDITWKSYPGVINGFTNPDSDRIHSELGSAVAYNKEADEQSWSDMQKFLAELFER